MRIQLLTFEDCPSARPAREALLRAIAEAGLDVGVEELDTASPLTSPTLRGWGSPTILVNGRDIAGEIGPLGGGCRLYRQPDGELRGVPPASVLDAALRQAIPAAAG